MILITFYDPEKSDFVSIVAEKRATIPPKSGRSYCLDQGFTALPTKMSPLWGFWIHYNLPSILT
tara:strand:- start:4025 stop:4216 length:192 start_codon:yes stop_codon:yes gene_type:complete